MIVEQDELLWDFKVRSDRTVDKMWPPRGDSSIREKEYKKRRNTRSTKKQQQHEKVKRSGFLVVMGSSGIATSELLEEPSTLPRSNA